jgi:asparagine synthase (glutamine-hydrolysing)
MCGLCGVVYHDPTRQPDEARLTAMRDVMAYRGPDDAGLYHAPGIALGSRRLAILDLSPRGHMPMASADGRYWIAYNGEVYNYRELRPALAARGYQFRSNSDTEVLLNLFIAEGAAMLQRLNGMFALAIWDSVERKLFLARDRIGVKPLYYSQQPDALYFGSEPKTLFAAGVPAEFDATTWEELLCFRYVAGTRTPFVNVERLLPGHYLTWHNGQIEIKRWWNLSERAQAQSNITDAVGWFRETFDSAVNVRRISDVPIGVLLSGGLDSSSVAASLAVQAGSGINTFTVRFAEAGYDEGPLAQQLAEKWQLNYHELFVQEDDLLGRLQAASWLNDEPLVHGNDLYLWAISEYAKPIVTVLLSGEGADETLGGYVRYRPLQHPLLLKAARPVLSNLTASNILPPRLRKLGRFLQLGNIERIVLFNSCETLPHELDVLETSARGEFSFRDKILREAQQLYPDNLVRQAMYSDQHAFLSSILDRNDRMTMGASIECRVPFLDYRLVEGLASLPSAQLLAGRESKHLLRAGLGERLPEAIRRGRKWGFGVPWAKYFRDVPELREWVAQLPYRDPIATGPFMRQRLQTVVKEFLAGATIHDALIRQLVMVSVWHQSYFEKVRELQPR